MRSGRLLWFAQKKTCERHYPKRIGLTVPGASRRGRPKKTCHQRMKDDVMGVAVLPIRWSLAERSGEAVAYDNVFHLE